MSQVFLIADTNLGTCAILLHNLVVMDLKHQPPSQGEDVVSDGVTLGSKIGLERLSSFNKTSFLISRMCLRAPPIMLNVLPYLCITCLFTRTFFDIWLSKRHINEQNMLMHDSIRVVECLKSLCYATFITHYCGC